MLRYPVPGLVAAALLVTTSVSAQELRADLIAQAQAEKAQQLKPYEPGRAERLALQVKRRLFETPEGFYPWFDSVYSGGGLTGGAGYKKFYGDRTFWDARGLFSVKGYKLAELTTDSVGLGHGSLDLHAAVGWRDATQVSYFGVGGDTSPDAKSNFHMTQAYAAAAFKGRGPGPVVFDFNVAWEDYSFAEGTGNSPSIEQLHTPATAPGLGDEPSFAHMTWAGGIDTRPAAGYARRGGRYTLAYDSFFDPDDTYSFDRLQADVVQHIPILRENWVLSFHGVARTTLDDEQTVPFFLLPALGSGSTLRAYPSWRFRDRHSLLVSGEWRWVPSKLFLDLALFYDAGKVTARREDLNFADLKTDVGIGVRFHGPLTTPVRIDVAHGSEGFNIVFSGAAPF
jgi:hypothetical protein